MGIGVTHVLACEGPRCPSQAFSSTWNQLHAMSGIQSPSHAGSQPALHPLPESANSPGSTSGQRFCSPKVAAYAVLWGVGVGAAAYAGASAIADLDKAGDPDAYQMTRSKGWLAADCVWFGGIASLLYQFCCRADSPLRERHVQDLSLSPTSTQNVDLEGAREQYVEVLRESDFVSNSLPEDRTGQERT